MTAYNEPMTDLQPPFFPDELRATLANEVTSVAGPYSPRFPSNPLDRKTAQFVQAALHKLGHEVSIGEAAAFWQNYTSCLQAEWSDDAYTVLGAVECIKEYCQFKAADPA